MSAVQLLPFFVLLQHSGATPGQIQGVWGMPAWGWANFIVPMFRCTKAMMGPYIQPEQQWTSSYYAGIGVLALGLVAVFKVKSARVYWLALAALLGMLLALGEHTFLYSAIKGIFPAFAGIRYPVKFVVLAVFALPLLAGFAAVWAESCSLANSVPAASTVRKSFLSVGAALLVLLVAIVCVSRLFPYPEESWVVTLKNGASRAVFLLLIPSAFYLRLKSSGHRRTVIGGIVLILLGLDALTHTARQNPTVSIEADRALPLAMSAKPQPGLSRAMVSPQMQVTLENAATPDHFSYYTGLRRAEYADCNLLDQIPKVNGFYSLYLREEAQLRARIYGVTNPPAGLLDFLSVSQISSSRAMFAWEARTTYLPWIAAGQKPVFLPANETLNAVASEDFNPHEIVYLPVEAKESGSFLSSGDTTAPMSKTRIESIQISAHRSDFKVTTPAPTWATIAQCWYPCWRAYVDEKPTRLWRANYVYQGVAIPAGEHSVRLVYQDRMFYLGAAITLSTILGLIGCLWVTRAKA